MKIAVDATGPCVFHREDSDEVMAPSSKHGFMAAALDATSGVEVHLGKGDHTMENIMPTVRPLAMEYERLGWRKTTRG